MVDCGAVADQGAAVQVGIAEIVGELSHDFGLIVEDMAVERVDEVVILMARVVPGEGGTGDESKVADGEIMPMAVITPIGVEISGGVMFEALDGGVL